MGVPAAADKPYYCEDLTARHRQAGKHNKVAGSIFWLLIVYISASLFTTFNMNC